MPTISVTLYIRSVTSFHSSKQVLFQLRMNRPLRIDLGSLSITRTRKSSTSHVAFSFGFSPVGELPIGPEGGVEVAIMMYFSKKVAQS